MEKQASLFTPPLRTRGRHIVDATGKRFKLASVNLYGGSDELFVVGGLDIRHRNDVAQLILGMGFNSVRLPYSDELVLSNPLIPANLLTANPDLFGVRAIDAYVAVAEALADAGLAVIINNHITQAGWCDGRNLCDSGWSNTHLGPVCRVRQSEDQWIEHWETLMTRLKDNPRIVGADLRNEPRGLWGTMRWSTWAKAAARCAERLHAIQPEWLMIVEGTSSANDLSGARSTPVQLSIPNKLVYSVHVFQWSGWGQMNQYGRSTYPDFVLAMQKNWAYLLEEKIAPVWVAELGASREPSKEETNYWEHLIQYLTEVDADWGYWAINPRKPHKNEEETWGLIADDWQKVLDDFRLKSLKPLIEPHQALE